MDPQTLSTSQVCSLLGISLSTFYRYCKNGLEKPIFFTQGGYRRFSLADISQTFSLSLSNNLFVTYSRVSSSDVIELMTVFCAKLYGKRSHSNKKIVA